jgi:hypothetical protein
MPPDRAVCRRCLWTPLGFSKDDGSTQTPRVTIPSRSVDTAVTASSRGIVRKLSLWVVFHGPTGRGGPVLTVDHPGAVGVASPAGCELAQVESARPTRPGRPCGSRGRKSAVGAHMTSRNRISSAGRRKAWTVAGRKSSPSARRSTDVAT